MEFPEIRGTLLGSYKGILLIGSILRVLYVREPPMEALQAAKTEQAGFLRRLSRCNHMQDSTTNLKL